MLLDHLVRTVCTCLFFFVVNLCATCAQETESELSTKQLDALNELRAKGAVIEKMRGLWVATLNDGNELHIPQEDGTYRIEKQTKWSGTVEQIRRLGDLPIHTVQIMRKSFTDAELNAITELKATKKLVLHLEHSDVSPGSLIGIGNMVDLVELFVQSPTISHEIIDEISTLQNLRILGFSNCDLAAVDLLKIHRLPSLESLSIGWTQLNEGALSELAKFDKLKQLKLNNIDLSGIPAPDLRDLKSLDSVSLTQVTISNEWIRAISQLRGLSSVTFYGTNLTDEQFEILVPALILNDDVGDRLVTLYLDRTKISDDTVELIRSTDAMRYAKAFVVLPPTVTERAAKSLSEANPTWQIVHYRMIGGRLVASQAK